MPAASLTLTMIDSLPRSWWPPTCWPGTLAVAALVAAMLPVARCDGQAHSERWTVGLGMQAPMPPEWGVTANVARAITASVKVPLRLEGSVAVSVRHIGRVCVDWPCDTRVVGQSAELAVVTSQFAPAAFAVGEFGVLAGGGIYVSRWGRGMAVGANHQVIDDGRGFGPSGLLLEAGIALRRVLRQPVMIEAVVRSYAGSRYNSKLTLAARIAKIF